MSELPPLPGGLVEAFYRLCRGEFSHRLPRTHSRDEQDTAAFLFNAIAEELTRIVTSSREQEERLVQAVGMLSDALIRVAAGDFTVKVERDYRGDPLDVLVFLVDSTIEELARLVADQQRKAAETRENLEHLVAERTRQLRDGEENLRRLFDAAPAPMVLFGEADGLVASCNERAAAIFETTREGALGRHASDIFEDRDWQAFLGSLGRDGLVEGLAVRLRRREGEPTWALVTARLLHLGGQRLVMASFADLTEQKRVEARLRRIATTDALTGTLGRSRFFEVAADEITRAERHGRPLCFAMLDLDHFKAVNDRFGHSVGDEALELVARTLRERLRRHDQIGRYGGEEFAVVLPETPLSAARVVIERAREAVERLALVRGGQQVALRLSAGVVAFKAGETVADALKRADDAMYEAKNAGRNRVVALD